MRGGAGRWGHAGGCESSWSWTCHGRVLEGSWKGFGSWRWGEVWPTHRAREEVVEQVEEEGLRRGTEGKWRGSSSEHDTWGAEGECHVSHGGRGSSRARPSSRRRAQVSEGERGEERVGEGWTIYEWRTWSSRARPSSLLRKSVTLAALERGMGVAAAAGLSRATQASLFTPLSARASIESMCSGRANAASGRRASAAARSLAPRSRRAARAAATLSHLPHVRS